MLGADATPGDPHGERGGVDARRDADLSGISQLGVDSVDGVDRRKSGGERDLNGIGLPSREVRELKRARGVRVHRVHSEIFNRGLEYRYAFKSLSPRGPPKHPAVA